VRARHHDGVPLPQEPLEQDLGHGGVRELSVQHLLGLGVPAPDRVPHHDEVGKRA
jgi:hypothetical protein